MTLTETWAHNLRRRMTRAKVSVQTLADVCGTSTTAVYKWLDGGACRMQMLEKVASALGTTPARLLASPNERIVLRKAA